MAPGDFFKNKLKRFNSCGMIGISNERTAHSPPRRAWEHALSLRGAEGDVAISGKYQQEPTALRLPRADASLCAALAMTAKELRYKPSA